MTPIRSGMLYGIGFSLLAAGVAGGFYCGWVFRGAQLPAPATSAPPAAAAPGFRGFGARPAVSGRVVSVKGGTVVVHDAATDTDVAVVLAPGATITRTQSVAVKPSSLSPSDSLVVFGQQQPDGSVLASSAVVGSAGPTLRTGRARPSTSPSP